MDARRLEVFREVASRGSFSAAARALYLTQPAVSRHVAKLEDEVGMRLLDRTPRGLHLTDAGRALLARADAIGAQLVAADAELRALRELDAGSLRIASFPSAAAGFVLTAIAAFLKRHPAVELSFEESGPAHTIASLRAGELDVGVIFETPEDAARPLEALARVHLLDDPMLAALPRSHPLAGRRVIPLERLAAEPWLTGKQPRGLIYQACVAAGFEPNVVALSDDSAINQGLVAAGLAVTLVPSLAAARARKDIALVPLKEPLVRVVSAVVLEGARRAPTVTAMLELLETKAPRA
jgi:DNA-binding transcriptional LysR family regulator